MHITTRSLLLLALAAPAIGQNDFALDKTTPGALGAQITLRVVSANKKSSKSLSIMSVSVRWTTSKICLAGILMAW